MNEQSQRFHAVLFPHRSLSRPAFRILMAVITVALGLAALRMWMLGAWPVALFAVADIVLIYGAFQLSYRSGRAFEEVSVSDKEVLLRKVTPGGKVTEHRFNPVWVRLAVTRKDDEGVVRLDLGSHGRWVPVGAFLNPDDRESFADAFSLALSHARRAA